MATNELALAKLVQEFNFSLPVGTKPEDLDMSEVNGIAVHKKVPLHVVVATLYDHVNKLSPSVHHSVTENKSKWERPSPFTLTYAFLMDHMIDYLSLADIKSAFERSFSRWSAVIPVNFTEVDDDRFSDISIGFFEGDHGDGDPFEGRGGQLAHATWPEIGMLHLDKGERWSVDFEKEKAKSAVDLESVATHEIGHLLGLDHSRAKKSVMYHSIGWRTKKVNLTVDDVAAIQALYGANPNFNVTSLDHSSSWSIVMEVRRLTGWTLLLGMIVCLISVICNK
ncbi:OLC1v1013291C1 [Oldenlandia corymbosa var. corymbosa]|uniref:OLC1v1013291C1 n=1 Tax=Oldenlandia corymbosa var. corymbosa TaxID=529605 RepID=A0AAV1E1J3_OLDCO|nr:OLC1v1013291C1 [Oldenlandia corymbosa var. corymbosa]